MLSRKNGDSSSPTVVRAAENKAAGLTARHCDVDLTLHHTRRCG